ncbi:unnamed protein product [Adineta ricciae]|uniref:Uncharacterized protein n=1 Tax=Adineta ricciae TaxID=249248 RepID=A0A815DBX5_ADIRI|nr:unnamed protein product [Adineta ricciae]CAF1295169.1 unnamed protein product [Adineta ricciae]
MKLLALLTLLTCTTIYVSSLICYHGTSDLLTPIIVLNSDFWGGRCTNGTCTCTSYTYICSTNDTICTLQEQQSQTRKWMWMMVSNTSCQQMLQTSQKFASVTCCFTNYCNNQHLNGAIDPEERNSKSLTDKRWLRRFKYYNVGIKLEAQRKRQNHRLLWLGRFRPESGGKELAESDRNLLNSVGIDWNYTETDSGLNGSCHRNNRLGMFLTIQIEDTFLKQQITLDIDNHVKNVIGKFEFGEVDELERVLYGYFNGFKNVIISEFFRGNWNDNDIVHLFLFFILSPLYHTISGVVNKHRYREKRSATQPVCRYSNDSQLPSVNSTQASHGEDMQPLKQQSLPLECSAGPHDLPYSQMTFREPFFATFRSM